MKLSKTAVAVAVLIEMTAAKMVTKHGERNNTDDEGNFKHPFLGQEHEVDVDTINYPDIGGFSIKLEKKESPNYNKYAGRIIEEQEENPELHYVLEEGNRF